MKERAFKELTDRKNRHVFDYARGKLLEYEDFRMQEYLMKMDIDISLDENIWFSNCRTNDIDIKTNFQWK